jgi:TolB protein
MRRRTLPLVLAAVALLVGPLPARADVYDVSGEIVVMNGDGTGDKEVTQGSGDKAELAWSPDGKHIAFTAWEEINEAANTNLFVMADDGSALRRLVDDPVSEHGPVWSADGKRIAFWRPGPNGSELHAVSVETGEVSPLREVPGTVPVLSPDWSTVAYSRLEGRYEQLYVAANGQERRVTIGSGSKSASEWSPDGARLAFTVHGSSPGHYNTDVWIMNADGSDSHQVTTDARFEGAPTWSPDGQFVAYYVVRDSRAQIFYSTDRGPQEKNLSNRQRDEANPAWSPDGRLAFIRS